MKPTMQDVADLAQVSRATVSRVLGDSANVSPHKRALVLEAVQKLGYEPHKRYVQALIFLCVFPRVMKRIRSILALLMEFVWVFAAIELS